MKYEEHPLSQLLPMMSGEGLRELAEDIRENGQRAPITLLEGKILDGRNRYKACEIAKVVPRFRDFNGGGDPLAFVISANLRRRHLSESQRAMIAAKIAGMRRGGDQSANIKSGAKTVEEAATALNVSPRSVAAAKRVLKEAAPEEVEAIERGEKTVTEVARKAAAKQERPEKREDRTGYAIPESILFDWERAEETAARMLRSISDTRSELRRALEEQDLIYREITTTTLADLNNAYASLKCVRPYAVCSSCAGHNRAKCSLCQGRGFLSEFAWGMFVPAEIKKMRGGK